MPGPALRAGPVWGRGGSCTGAAPFHHTRFETVLHLYIYWIAQFFKLLYIYLLFITRKPVLEFTARPRERCEEITLDRSADSPDRLGRARRRPGSCATAVTSAKSATFWLVDNLRY